MPLTLTAGLAALSVCSALLGISPTCRMLAVGLVGPWVLKRLVNGFKAVGYSSSDARELALLIVMRERRVVNRRAMDKVKPAPLEGVPDAA